MIIHLKKNTTAEMLDAMTKQLKAFHIKQENRELLITSSGLKEIPTQFENYVEEKWVFDSDMQLSSKTYNSDKTEIDLGTVKIGGDTNNT
ncbi:MAG: hypothetical protein HOK92_10030, partial [Flavobacteriales bacterium]|nr:hypothetical protein [Flavobacteriales bacterium]